MDMKRFIRPNIESLLAYKVKEIPCKVKLDANESPYGFKDGSKVLKSIETNRYPDPEAKTLKKMISRYFAVKPENILQGNGSDEMIYYLVTTFGGPVLYPIPTFSMYGIITQAIGEKRIEIPLDEEFDLDLERILKAIKMQRPKLIFLSSPNNPTGNCFSSDRILRIIETTSSLVSRHASIVILDEAYQPFASDKGFMPLLKDFKNLVIMRTLSKIGLAGLRVGFLIADEKIINEVNKVRLPFNLNSVSQALAVEALKNRNVLKSYIKSIVSERERLFNEMTKILGIKPYPSEANFILFKTENPDRIYQGLLKKGVLIRNMKEVVDGCLRVTVGKPGENRIFLNALKDII